MSKHQKIEEQELETTENSPKTGEAATEMAENGLIFQDSEGKGGADPSSDPQGAENSPKDSPGEETACQEARTLEEKNAELEAKLAAVNDQYLRKAAEFENFRKRMNQEKQNAIDFANQSLLLDLISVIDDFERAIKAAETQREEAGNDGERIAAGYRSLFEGIGMIEKNLVTLLENKWGLTRFDSAGESFDPNRHEAIMMEKSADVQEPAVTEEFIKGYILKDRVIRPAKVKVVMPE
ncbi:MAG: nucleotide exchange factor GrpE [Spirochaetaceae bacterium]|jgi:molecular chaperone GrpE|nr:nucleotide exchange factor GrpE [Spirochaetaceae bacterium]